MVFTAGIVLDQGKISSLSKELLEELDNVNLKRNADHFATTPFFKQFKNYDNFLEVLNVLVHSTCEKASRGVYGPPFCEIGECCEDNSFKGFWKCGSFESFEELDFLKPTHDNSHIQNLRIINKEGMEKFLAGKRNW